MTAIKRILHMLFARFDNNIMVTALAEDAACRNGGESLLWSRLDETSIARQPFVAALAVWVSCQPDEATVRQAAAAFHATPEVIREAVSLHAWMYLSGDVIELDGL